MEKGSRLMQMQARFQQKQMQEREMKIANLYEAQQARALDRVRHSPSNGVRNSPNNGTANGISSNGSSISSPPQPVSRQPGKVRQMFEERRTKAGIDKSYPLQPIHNTDRTRKALPNGYSKVTATTNTTSRVVEKRTTKTKTSQALNSQSYTKKTENIVNGSGDLNHNHEPDLNSLRHALPQSNGEPIVSTDEVDKSENNYLLEDETFPDALAPTTPRSPEPVAPPRKEVKAPPRRSPAARTSPPKAKPQAATPPRRVISENAVTETRDARAKGAMQKGVSPTPSSAPKRQPLVQTPRNNSSSPTKSRSTLAAPGSGSGSGDACTVCGRRFASDRLAKHQEICKKAHAKKRKPFDALKHRLAGTEAEPFINKVRKGTPSSTKVKSLNSTWRQKHEEFINAIRAAKQVQAHLASGGKLSDLPPPPPSENPDYVACPHCGRRFNQGAAERHIPKCKNFQFNKPKPAAKRR